MADNPASTELPNAGDRYRVEAFLGEGAMGRVYRAYDRQLERPVALKFLRASDPGETARILAEARAQASLEHEHICRVFDVGEVDGKGYLAMQLVDGPTLSELAPGLELETRVRLVEQAARAVHEAHRSGVVHRDLNPANILVEPRAGGRLHAYVVDFGIAGEAGSDRPCRDPAAAGAPAFMAPEQLRGEPFGSEPAADVYGLGATLYAVLAGQAPFFAETRRETARQAAATAPVRLGLVAPGTPAALETITEIAMAKAPDGRYADAASLADDLGRWLSGAPVVAGTASAGDRLRPWFQARWSVLAAATGALLVVTLAVSATLWLRGRELTRTALTRERHRQIERMDRVLRSARMLPLHDTARAEQEVRRELVAVEASLMEHGPLARSTAYAVLGHGHLLLREFAAAEQWLAAAVDAGLDDARTETALGIARAMLLLEGRRTSAGESEATGAPSVVETIANLERRGPETAHRDLFHQALVLAITGRTTDAVDVARSSASETPWLYEAAHLEGDLLVDRSRDRFRHGDVAGAIVDLERAGDAYARGLAIGRSDGWLYQAEAVRSFRLARLLDPADPRAARCLDAALDAARRASIVHPDRVEPLVLSVRAAMMRAEHPAAQHDVAVRTLDAADVALNRISELDPNTAGLADLRSRVDELRSESRGVDSR
jgi:predicted Ser/Thr protein kinase